MLKENNIDGLILKSNANILYCAKINLNHYELEGFALVCHDQTHIITDGRYQVAGENICRENKNITLHIISGKNYFETLKDVIIANNLKEVGFEENAITIKDYDLLKSDKFNLVPTNNIVEDRRIIKTKEEQQIIREAYKITNDLWDHIKDFAQIGMKESDIVLEMYNYILKHGGTGFSFDPIIASGINSTKPHAGWTNKVIESGDIMTLDFGIVYQNYCTDVTKNIAFGEVNEQLKEIFELCVQANKKAISLIKDGVSIAEVDEKSRQIIEQAGYGKYYNHSLGHGIGLQIHEQPGLSKKNTGKFKNGQVVTIEPGIYLPQIGGVRVESAGIVNENGIEILTNSRKLITVK